MKPDANHNTKTLTEAVPHLETGDLLLVSASGWFGRLISVGTWGSEHSHVASVVWLAVDDGDLFSASGYPFVVEMVEPNGGRIVPMDWWLEQEAGRKVDVYRPNPTGKLPYNRVAAAAWLVENVPGRPYGWRRIWEFLLRSMMVTRLFYRPLRREKIPRARVCSTVRIVADRVAGGWDAFPRLADGCVAPGHFEQSDFYGWQFSLVADPKADNKPQEDDDENLA